MNKIKVTVGNEEGQHLTLLSNNCNKSFQLNGISIKFMEHLTLNFDLVNLNQVNQAHKGFQNGKLIDWCSLLHFIKQYSDWSPKNMFRLGGYSDRSESCRSNIFNIYRING